MEGLKQFQNPDIQYWPEVRWWLAEGFHTDQTLKAEIASLYDAGFGAVEFLAMEEPGADSRLYGWGSEEWVHDSHIVVEEATKRGMGVSMTSGTNWANANLITITPDDRAASKELDYAVEKVAAGSWRKGVLPKPELFMPGVTLLELEAVVAIRVLEERDGNIYLDEQSSLVLTDQICGEELEWRTPGDGDYLLFSFWMHGTGQTAEPSVSTSFTINYMDRYGIDALIAYWDRTVFTPELRERVEKNGRAMMYMDSLELATFGRGGQFWGYHLREEFKKRRGYDVTPYLPFIVKDPGMMKPVYHYHYFSENERFLDKLYHDLYQTMTDLYMENMLRPMQEWLHTHGMSLRAEISYGLPFEISLPGKYVDGIETESLEFASQIESYRNLAGPAHIYNRMYSSETGATKLNYMMGLDFYNQIIFTQFAAGVAKTVLHGYSSIAGSEASTYWPGHEGMWPVFSERFGSRQPSFLHYREWTAMIARYQMILRQGKPRMDLGILRLDYDFNNLLYQVENESVFYERELMRGGEGIYWKDMQLQNAGYTWDYFAPQILEEAFVDVEGGLLLPEGPGYQALLIYQEFLPVKSAEKILALAEKGLQVLFVNGVNESLRPGGVTRTHKEAACMTPFHDGEDERLGRIVERIKKLPNVKELDDQREVYKALMELGVCPRAEFAETNQKLLTHMREDGRYRYLFVYHMQYTETEEFTCAVKVRGEGKPYRIDCWNGEVEEIGHYCTEGGCTILNLRLAPGQASLYVIDCGAPGELHVVETDAERVLCENGSLKIVAAESKEYRAVLSDGKEVKVFCQVPKALDLPVWNLRVESWKEGEKREITEDRGLGVVTKEVYYETEKEEIPVGETTLKSWKDIEKVGAKISGVGRYTTSFVLPDEWGTSNRAVFWMETIHGHTAAVYVNGRKARNVDMDSLEVDVTELVHSGENEILVEVTTSLNNCLLARGYYERVGELSRSLAANANNAGGVDGEEEKSGSSTQYQVSAVVKDYGMTGAAGIKFYTKAAL